MTAPWYGISPGMSPTRNPTTPQSTYFPRSHRADSAGPYFSRLTDMSGNWMASNSISPSSFQLSHMKGGTRRNRLSCGVNSGSISRSFWYIYSGSSGIEIILDFLDKLSESIIARLDPLAPRRRFVVREERANLPVVKKFDVDPLFIPFVGDANTADRRRGKSRRLDLFVQAIEEES